MKRVTGILILLALAYMATACSNGPSSGTVVGHNHDAAYSYWAPGIDTPGSCSMIGKIESCTPGVHIPGHEQYVPESWELKLDNGEHSGWRDVGEQAYNACAEQSHYPECAGR